MTGDQRSRIDMKVAKLASEVIDTLQGGGEENAPKPEPESKQAKPTAEGTPSARRELMRKASG